MTRCLIEISLPHDAAMDSEALRKHAAKALLLPNTAIAGVELIRRALDARRRQNTPVFKLTLEVELLEGAKSKKGSVLAAPTRPHPRLISPRAPKDAPPVVVVGAGPAGLFAAWHLAEHGANVHLLERGKVVERRARDFGRFRGRGQLDPESNICFGEGGAGTYSDGKLTTRTKDPLVREILERMVEVGAPDRILVDAKPHIGTNLLYRMLQRLRARLLSLGVSTHFETRFESLVMASGRVTGVHTNQGSALPCGRALLAVGHSARDTFRALLAQGVPMERKPFAVGVRVEHPQSLIDRSQYRIQGPRPITLPPADYRLSHTEAGRGIYSFCMCPGGMVVPTATEAGTVVVNGMSTAHRSSPFANSGVVVQIAESDIEAAGFGDGPLSGVEFQRSLEMEAFVAGGKNYFAPAMTAADFVARRSSGQLADTHFRPGLEPADLALLFPPFITKALRAGLARFDQQLFGYASSEANLIGVESRTSSPLRIPRDPATFLVPGFSGLYVAGEGPGYAGGITSAAVDGLRAAHLILRSLAGV